jgi:hypothetical protein
LIQLNVWMLNGKIPQCSSSATISNSRYSNIKKRKKFNLIPRAFFFSWKIKNNKIFFCSVTFDVYCGRKPKNCLFFF